MQMSKNVNNDVSMNPPISGLWEVEEAKARRARNKSRARGEEREKISNRELRANLTAAHRGTS